MTNIYGLLNISRSSILAQQTGIEVTGQNLANVNTPGYSRQLVEMQASSLGTGVKLGSITRAADGFITSQLNSSASNQSFYKTANRAVSLLETIFNESDNRGMSNSVSQFFNSFHDLSLNAKGMTERTAVIANASLMADNMRRISSDLNRTQTNMEEQIKQTVTQVNVLTSEITDLSKTIHASEKNQIQANDLRDRRDEKVKALADILDITTYEDPGTKELIITTTKGKTLVMGQTAFQMETSINGNNNGLVDVNINDGQGNLTNITQEINSGSLKGHLYVRDTVIPGYLNRLDKFAAGIIREVNRVHSSGYGLDKNRGVDFFSSLSVTARSDVNNAGNATISGVVGQQGFVSTDNYRIDITGGGSFSLFNVSRGSASGTFSFSSGSAVDLGNGIRVTLSGSAQAGDKFTFNSSEGAALSMAVNSAVSADPNKVAAGKTLFPGDGSNATSLADLQNSLVFQGNTLLAGSGAVTFQEYYASLVGDVGIESLKAAQGMEHQDAIQKQLFSQREGIAGVSIDEEMVNIIKFQQAYNASARLMSTVEEMLKALQQAI
ncbi:MAG: flagellar hook-associated protein FlgK [Nitrospinae bacterium]|nr:flagellar hook-associated protein FlgK [Nitrospinota bacterium]